jgi:hypothetical protein
MIIFSLFANHPKGQEIMTESTPPPSARSGNQTILIIVVVILLAATVGLFFLFQNTQTTLTDTRDEATAFAEERAEIIAGLETQGTAVADLAATRAAESTEAIDLAATRAAEATESAEQAAQAAEAQAEAEAEATEAVIAAEQAAEAQAAAEAEATESVIAAEQAAEAQAEAEAEATEAVIGAEQAAEAQAAAEAEATEAIASVTEAAVTLVAQIDSAAATSTQAAEIIGGQEAEIADQEDAIAELEESSTEIAEEAEAAAEEFAQARQQATIDAAFSGAQVGTLQASLAQLSTVATQTAQELADAGEIVQGPTPIPAPTQESGGGGTPQIATGPTTSFTVEDESYVFEYPANWFIVVELDNAESLVFNNVDASISALAENPTPLAGELWVFVNVASFPDLIGVDLGVFLTVSVPDIFPGATPSTATSLTIPSDSGARNAAYVDLVGENQRILVVDLGQGDYGFLFINAQNSELDSFMPEILVIASTLRLNSSAPA